MKDFWWKRKLPRLIYETSSTTPLSPNSQKRLQHKENQTKYRMNMSRKPQSHIKMLRYSKSPFTKNLDFKNLLG